MSTPFFGFLAPVSSLLSPTTCRASPRHPGQSDPTQLMRCYLPKQSSATSISSEI